MLEPEMEGELAPFETGMSIVRGCMVVPIPTDLDDEAVPAIRKEILNRIESTGVRGMVIDLSAVRVLDSFTFESLVHTAKMASLLGAKTVLSGIQPGVASSLVYLGVETDEVPTARTLEDAFQQLSPVVSPSCEPAGDDGEEPDDPEPGEVSEGTDERVRDRFRPGAGVVFPLFEEGADVSEANAGGVGGRST